MNDFEKLKRLFFETGINFEAFEEPGKVDYQEVVEYSKLIKLGEGVGYYDFNIKFYFDDKGNFLNHGIWE